MKYGLKIVPWYMIALCTVIAWVFLGWKIPIIDLSENQALYTFSSQAQVVAAIYGLTITGYIFLHNQQDRLADKDETIADVLDDIKIHQHYFITFLTVVSLASIFSAILAIVFRESPISALKVITQNSAAALFFVALLCTGYFVRDAMKPNKIEEASDRIKKEMESYSTSDGEIATNTDDLKVDPPEGDPLQMELSPTALDTLEETAHNINPNVLPSGSSRAGGFEQFLSNYNNIEKSLEIFSNLYLELSRPVPDDFPSYEKHHENKKLRHSNWTKPRIVHAMLAQGVVSQRLAENLLELIRYRNALVHGRDFFVPQEMLERVRKANSELSHVIFKQSSY